MSKALILPLVLLFVSACVSAPPTTGLTPDRAYGAPAPSTAQILAPEEFQRRLDSGQLALTRADDAATRRTAAQQQQAQDLNTLAGLTNPSDALRAFLGGQTNAKPTVNGDLAVQTIGTDGKLRTFLTLGTAAVAHGLVGAARASSDPANTLEVYRAAYRLLTPTQAAALPAPDALNGKAITEIRAALSSLDSAQGEVRDLDLVRGEVAGAAVKPQRIAVNDGLQPGAGNGTDTSGRCASPSPDGLLGRLRWPLKTFVSPIKDQAARGTCWAFSAVGALESRALVTDGTSIDLSEQHFVNLRKLSTPGNFDGDWPRDALDDLAARGNRLATESAWTYNPSPTCAPGYTGLCSDTVHQNPMTCTVANGVTFCGFEPVVYTGTAAQASVPSNLIWSGLSADQSRLPLGVVRTLIADGTTLILSFSVTQGFNNLGSSGFLTDLGDGQPTFGLHAVQVVGFIPDSLAPFAPAVTGGSGGGWFVVKNSWGCTWGDAGYGYLPVSFVQRKGLELDALSMPSARSAAFNSVRDALTNATPPTPVVTGIRVIGGPLELRAGERADFSAVVGGTGLIDPNAIWTLGTSTAGTLSRGRGTNTRYTAPANVTTEQRITLTATAVSDQSQSTAVTIIVRPALGGTLNVNAVTSSAGTFTSFDPNTPTPVVNQVTVTAALTAGTVGIARVDFKRGSVTLQSLALNPPLAPYQSSTATLVGDLTGQPPGPQTLFVLAYDAAGNEVARVGLAVNVLFNQPIIGPISPSSLTLSAPVGGSSNASFTFTNTGTAPLNAVVTPAAPWLTVVSRTPNPLGPGQTATVTVQASCPATPQTLNSSLRITNTDNPNQAPVLEVDLTCLPAVPLPSIGDPTPGVLNLRAAVGAPATASFTFTNTGYAPLNAVVKPASALDTSVAVVSSLPNPVAPGQTATVTLSATCPSSGIGIINKLTITANDPRVPDKQVTVNLTCADDVPLGIWVVGVSTQNVRPFTSSSNPTVVLGTVTFSGHIQASAQADVTRVQLIGNGTGIGQNTVLGQGAVSVPAGSLVTNINLLTLDTTTLANGLYTVTMRALDANGAFKDSDPFVVRVNNAGGPGPSSEIYSINGVTVAPGQAPVTIQKSNFTFDVNLYGGNTGYSGALYKCLQRAGQRLPIGQIPFGSNTGLNYPVPVNGVSPLEIGSNNASLAPTDTSNGNDDLFYLSGNPSCDSGSGSALPTTSFIRVIFTN
jgi:hypothetical protein